MQDNCMLEEVKLADLEILEEALAPSCGGWFCGCHTKYCGGTFCGC